MVVRALPAIMFPDFSNGVAVGDGFEDSKTVKAAMLEPEAEKEAVDE